MLMKLLRGLGACFTDRNKENVSTGNTSSIPTRGSAANILLLSLGQTSPCQISNPGQRCYQSAGEWHWRHWSSGMWRRYNEPHFCPPRFRPTTLELWSNSALLSHIISYYHKNFGEMWAICSSYSTLVKWKWLIPGLTDLLNFQEDMQTNKQLQRAHLSTLLLLAQTWFLQLYTYWLKDMDSKNGSNSSPIQMRVAILQSFHECSRTCQQIQHTLSLSTYDGVIYEEVLLAKVNFHRLLL